MALDERGGAAPRWSSVLLATHHPQLLWASHKEPVKPPLHWLHVEIIILILQLLSK